MKFLLILGIDPGITGAMAILGPNGDVLVADLPMMTIPNGARKQQVLDVTAMKNYLENWQTRHRVFVFLEKTQPMKDSAMTAFSMGQMRGSLLAICACLNISVSDVLPQAWKRKYNLLKCDKDASLGAAKQLFPSLAADLSRVKDHNRAEALLIAAYGKGTMNG